jgi:hypothetical protein
VSDPNGLGPAFAYILVWHRAASGHSVVAGVGNPR